MIGDSLTVGNFGEKFAATFLANRPAASFYQVAAWGSSPKDWTTGAPVFQSIGTAQRARGQAQVKDPTKAPFLAQLYRQWFGQPTHSTPKLSALVAEKKATHLIVALGTNQLGALQRNPADPDVPRSITKLITEARFLGIMHVDWIGPPVLQRFSSATIESFYRILELTLRDSDHQNFVTIWDSRRWIDAYPADFSFKDDGIHFFHSAGLRATSAWAKKAANAISSATELSDEIEELH